MIKLKIGGKVIDTKERFNDGAWVRVMPSGDAVEIDLEFKMRSRHSDIGEKISRAAIRKHQAAMQKAKGLVFADPDQEERDQIDFITALTVGWRGKSIAEDDGSVPAFSAAECNAFLTQEKWMVPQLDRATNEDARFLQV